MTTKARKIADIIGRISSNKLQSADLDVSFSNISDTGTEGTKVASGTTAQRGSTTGQFRFNSTTGLFEGYDGSVFKSLDVPPTLTSIDTTNIATDLGGTQTIVVTGTNFSNNSTIQFRDNGGTLTNADSITFNSSTQLTITKARSFFSNANEPYDIILTNPSGLQATLSDSLNVDNNPAWSTASGTLATIREDATGTHATVSASDPDGDTVVYSETGGSILSTNNLQLNSNSGAIFGDPTNVSSGSQTQLNFTLRATANSQTADRNFNIIVTKIPDGTSSALATANPTALYNDTGTNTSGVYWVKSSTFNSGTPVQAYFLYDGNNGYMMVCNYVHQGGTDPDLNNRTDSSLPLLSTNGLGTNESGTQYWGHINGGTSGGTGSFGTVNMVRWYGIGGANRTIHFENNNTGTINYCNTGSGSNSGIQSGYTTLSGHSANLPGVAQNFGAGWTSFAMYRGGQEHWGLKGGNRWEVDDYANGSQFNTIHRVWVRYSS